MRLKHLNLLEAQSPQAGGFSIIQSSDSKPWRLNTLNLSIFQTYNLQIILAYVGQGLGNWKGMGVGHVIEVELHLDHYHSHINALEAFKPIGGSASSIWRFFKPTIAKFETLEAQHHQPIDFSSLQYLHYISLCWTGPWEWEGNLL